MKKPILITLLCTGLMLVTPLSGVAQENKISNNISEQSNIEGLVAQITTVIDEILQRYRHIQVVKGLCNVVINSLGLIVDIIFCIILFIILILFFLLMLFITNIIGFIPYYLSSLVFALFLKYDNNCPPKTPFFFDWFSSFQSIYTMLETKDNLTQSFDGCPCL